ncbi:MAG: T9SS type A sorting domain-containing protein [Ferruginibacter sp.]
MLKYSCLFILLHCCTCCFCQVIQPSDQASSVKQPQLNCYPNPARNKITLSVEGFDPGLAQVKIIDIKGNLIRNDQRLLISGKEEIVVYLMIQSGTYILMVGQQQKWVKRKIIIR